MSDTDLTLEGVGKGNFLPRFSARECIQTLTPIPQGILRRTINGVLVCVGNRGHRKFQSTIVCKDKLSPAFEGLWKGSILKVGCIQPLNQIVPQEISRIQLEREPISIHLYDSCGKSWGVEMSEDRWISLPSHFRQGFILYRPSLTMIVKDFQLEYDEWGLTVGWKLELEEQ